MRFCFVICLLIGYLPASAQISWLSDDCPSVDLCLDFNSCTEATAKLFKTAVTACSSKKIAYSYKVDLGTNGSFDLQQSGDTIKIKFPPGMHSVQWRAVDQCGSVITCNYTVKVKDCQAPNLLCTNGLTQGLNDSCKATFLATSFISVLSDNCTPSKDLEIGMRIAGMGTGFPTSKSLRYSECESGLNFVEIWVRDAVGLTNSCQNYVLVQENTNKCPCIKESKVKMAGCVRSHGNKRLTQYDLKADYQYLPAGANTPPTKKSQQKNAADSCFNFAVEALPLKVNVNTVLTASRKAPISDGLSTLDLVLVSKHILGTEPFKSFYQVVAADINQSKSISAFDIVEGRKALLGLYDTFPLVPSWRFIKPVSNPLNTSAWNEVSDRYELSHQNLSGDANTGALDFIGIKMGDVNFSASLDGEAEDRDEVPPFALTAPALHIEAGAEAIIPVRTSESIALYGWQLGLRIDSTLGELTLISGIPPDQYRISADATQARALAYDAVESVFAPDESIFYLKIKARRSFNAAQALYLDTNLRTPEVYVENEQGDISARPLTLHFVYPDAQSANTRIYAPFPNPATDQVTIGILSPASQNLRLSVVDPSGRIVYERYIDAPKGYSDVIIPTENWGSYGLYAWQVSGENIRSTGQILHMK